MSTVLQVSTVNGIDVSTIINSRGMYETCVFWLSGRSKVVGIQSTKEAIETVHLETVQALFTGQLTEPVNHSE